MDLIHNNTFSITAPNEAGIYRVILSGPRLKYLVAARIDLENDRPKNRGGRSKLDKPKKAKKSPPPNVGDLIWIDTNHIDDLEARGYIKTIDILEAGIYATKLNDKQEVLYDHRIDAMRVFLDLDKLTDSILAHQSISELVKEAVKVSGLSKSIIYRLWSLLCRQGFNERSLRPRLDRCGAPGIARPCDSNGRKKAGRKTIAQRLSGANTATENTQPGMSSDWRLRIMSADKKIPTPKPSFPARYLRIIEDGFQNRYTQIDGKFIPSALVKGEYPNRSQVRRVLEKDIPRLERLLQKTTQGHFKRSHRGMVAKNWKGVAGPGHTWAIDSTVGDIYLRSSINRAWIIGRPAVYIIADVWSTAIVGFYVCLFSPSWDMVKLALFSSVADPNLIGELWGYQPMLSLNPYPTLPIILMCDRGEYLSKKARVTGMELIDCLSYAPPYRPDLKGLIEVLHRIEKDKQHLWIPGAIDARRKEFELRKFSPSEAIFTLREYVNYLYIMFTDYNLTADRTNRLDTHMIAAGTHPSPAGLWRWGHDVGIGVRRHTPQDQLIQSLLLKSQAAVTRQGVRFSGLHYESEIINEKLWTATARNFGSHEIDAFHYNGSVSRIWTPNLDGNGHIELRLSEQTRASTDQTLDEVLDAIMYSKVNTEDLVHWNLLKNLEAKAKVDKLISDAKSSTEEAISRNGGEIPSITESRNIEVTQSSESIRQHTHESFKPEMPVDVDDEYMQMMKELILEANSSNHD